MVTMWVLERGRELRFLDETPAALFVGHDTRQQNLQRDLAVQPRVNGLGATSPIPPAPSKAMALYRPEAVPGSDWHAGVR